MKTLLGIMLFLATGVVNAASIYFNTVDTTADIAAALGVSESQIETKTLIDDAASLAVANEVATPPLDNAALPAALTFSADLNWTLTATQPGGNFVWDDQEGGTPDWDTALSVGDINDWEDDDFVFGFVDTNVYFVSLTVLGNTVEAGEWLTVTLHDNTTAQIATSDIYSVFGDLSTYVMYSVGSGIKSVSFDEDPGSDDIAIANAYAYSLTAVPVPAAVWLFGSGLGLLGWFRRKA